MTIRQSGMKATPRTKKDIRKAASTIHKVFGLDPTEAIDVVKLIDILIPKGIPSFNCEIEDDSIMGDYHGLCYPSECRMILKLSVYDGAVNDVGKDRFTIAHELGHLFLHANGVALARTSNEDLKPYEDTEWQADQFAAELLMPFDEVVKLKSPEEIAKKFKVSMAAAKTRFYKVRDEKSANFSSL